MKAKYKIASISTLCLFLSGCALVAEVDETLDDQQEIITELTDQISELTQQLEVERRSISQLEFELEQLTQEQSIQEQPQIPEFQERQEWQTFLADDLQTNFSKLIADFIDIEFIDPIDEILFHNSEIWTDGHIVVRTQNRFPTISFIISYQMMDVGLEECDHIIHLDDWEDVSINWEVIGHIDTLNGFRFTQDRVARTLTDLETVTIQLHGWDGYGDWHYEEISIEGSQLWEETLRLMPGVWDLWYEDQTLFVDLSPTQAMGGGSVQNMIRSESLRRTFSSFPHVSEIRFTVFGHPRLTFITEGPGHNSSGVFNVEEGRWIWGCELEESDPHFFNLEICPDPIYSD